MARLDPHSFADSKEPVTKHIAWRATVNFEATRLEAVATLHFVSATTEATVLHLDTRDLAIESVVDNTGAPVPFEVGAADVVLGSCLTLQLSAGRQAVAIRYHSSSAASALQWLTPAQTHGGQHPYLFSQCQAIHARSVLPCQDTPARRVTYSASLTVPQGLIAVMAAASRGYDARDGHSTFHFEMEQAIPPYLLAFAVGALVSRDVSPRCRVWSEAGVVDKAAWEFADVERHMTAAEALFGPYDWERFDLLVMPPSFPYGGMENPRLTFLTPTLLAGDKSLVNVLAHELAHSWTGNLVTNTNAEHFWLNEGFTVYAERRIIEALDGVETAGLQAALGRRELEATVERFAQDGTPELSKLHTKLEGVDPDEAFSLVPYEKGYLFLRVLEDAMGRASFDGLLKSWLGAHRFGAVETSDFVAHVENAHPGLLEKVNAAAWLESPGIPSNAPASGSVKLDALNALRGTVPTLEQAHGWTPTEWQLFLDAVPRTVAHSQLRELEARFSLSKATNAEVLCAWLALALEAGLAEVAPVAETFLAAVGRMKYLKPLYRALMSRPETQANARACFARNKGRYHPIAQQVVAKLVA